MTGEKANNSTSMTVEKADNWTASMTTQKADDGTASMIVEKADDCFAKAEECSMLHKTFKLVSIEASARVSNGDSLNKFLSAHARKSWPQELQHV